MKSVLAIIALLAASVVAQDAAAPQLPECVTKCITKGLADGSLGCTGPEDKKCLCAPETQSKLLPCLTSGADKCTTEELAAAAAAQPANCADAGGEAPAAGGETPETPETAPSGTETATTPEDTSAAGGETPDDSSSGEAPAETTLVPSGTVVDDGSAAPNATGTEEPAASATGAAGRAAIAGSAVLAAIFALAL